MKPFPREMLRELLGVGDGRASCAIGVVEAREQGGPTYELEDGRARVDVALQGGEHVWARLAGGAGGRGVGIYSIPLAGSEVLVALPDGAIEGEAVVIATLDTGEAPDGLTAGGTTVIAVPAGERVLVHDGNAGDAKALVTKDDFDGHDHPLPQIVAPAGNAGGPCTVNPLAEVGATKGAAAAEGTSVLMAK